MSRFLLLLCTAAVSLYAELQCPNGYDLMGDGRCIRAVFVHREGKLGDALSNGIDECKRDGAYLPIIKSKQENAMFNRIFASFEDLSLYPRVLLGAVCNSTTRRMEWMDGSKIDYSLSFFDANKDCVASQWGVFSRPADNVWDTVYLTAVMNWTVMCVAEPWLAKNDPCGDYDQMPNPVKSSESCFKIYTNPMSWSDAAKKCADDFGSLATIYSDEENKFFWRTAVSNGLVNGIHIGAYQSAKDVFDWRWIDDNSPVSNYNNFDSGSGGGMCSELRTDSSTASWTNEDCNIRKLPFICRRIAYSDLPTACTNELQEEGKIILPPGFPRPSIPCEYVLVVDSNSLIQLEVIAFEANPDVDYLYLYQDTVGNSPRTKLTGTNLTQTTYTSWNNVLRVNWMPDQTDRPPSYRGFRIRYKAIPNGK